jgi:flagellar motor protein MotB
MSPSKRRRIRSIVAAAVVVIAVASFFVARLLLQHANTTFNEIAIQPQPASQATVGADVLAELAQARANGGQLMVTELAGAAGTAPGYSGRLSCSPDANSLLCADAIKAAYREAAGAAAGIVASPAPADPDIYAVFMLTAGYLSQHPVAHQAINIWINTTGDQVAPVSLAHVSARDVAVLVRRATAGAEFPGPHGCQGYRVHMVVPPSGSPAHQLALRDLLTRLIARCGGSLASWTPRWVAPSAGLIKLPPIKHAQQSQNGRSFTLSEHLGDFAVDSAALTPGAKTALRQIAAVIDLRAPGQPVTCTGSTDGTGTAAFDLALSRRRARAVCGYLAGAGIRGSLLHSVGAGKGSATVASPALRKVVVDVG